MSAPPVVVTWLAMRSPAQHRAAGPLPATATLHHAEPSAAGAVAREMYHRVGADWQWRDRLSWSLAEWEATVQRPGVELWTLALNGVLAGYFELDAHPDAIELKYFGLLPDWVGRGLGGPFLSAAIDRAWHLGLPRVMLNTCTLDHPAALKNYLARGFEVVRTAVRSDPA